MFGFRYVPEMMCYVAVPGEIRARLRRSSRIIRPYRPEGKKILIDKNDRLL